MVIFCYTTEYADVPCRIKQDTLTLFTFIDGFLKIILKIEHIHVMYSGYIPLYSGCIWAVIGLSLGTIQAVIQPGSGHLTYFCNTGSKYF